MDRRKFLFRWGAGFGGLALCAMASCPRGERRIDRRTASAGGGGAPKAKSVIFLYMEGGPSQVDTFDPKPRLDAEHGETIRLAPPATQFKTSTTVMKSPFRFKRCGRSGLEISDLFPCISRRADDLAVIRSMTSEHSEHTSANYFLNTGAPSPGRPSMGAWISYGLGSLSENLPSYVVLDSGHMPLGGVDCFSNGFLPASHQGAIFRRSSGAAMPDLAPLDANVELQRSRLALTERLNRRSIELVGASRELEATIANYEMAFRMQSSVPALVDVSGESPATRRLYGVDEPETAVFGAQCLVARRLVEQGVRFIQLLPPKLEGITSWDQHNDLEKHHRANAVAVDRPIAGLLEDLAGRGLLDSTVVLWGGEFGRTPVAQITTNEAFGRDHNPYGFSIWMAGGGVRGGACYGATDDYGYFAVENPVSMHDLHATLLHLLGLDHTALTFRHGGRDYRLTDVYGEVVNGILA
jgi:hypothetical protein